MLRLLVLSVAVVCGSAMVCLPDTCQTARCAAVTAENCVGGTIVKNGGFCGCCDVCHRLLAEGDSCFDNFLFGVPPQSECGDGLHCDTHSMTCQKTTAAKRQVLEGQKCFPYLMLGAPSQNQCGDQLACDPNTLTCKRPADILRATQTCAERLQEIQRAQTNGLPLLGQFVPTCESDGSYSARQCHGSVCYCVDPKGAKISGYQASIGQSANMDCKCARDQYAYMQTGLIGKLFYCTSSGSYQRYACSGSVCYCADNLGAMKAGSPTVNIGNIGSLQC